MISSSDLPDCFTAFFSAKTRSFHRARRPVGEELKGLLDTLSGRIVRVLERRGLLVADPAFESLEDDARFQSVIDAIREKNRVTLEQINLVVEEFGFES